MKHVGVLEAKTHLSRLLDEIEKTGEPVVITRHGKPVATIWGGAGPLAEGRSSQAVAALKAWRETVEPAPDFDALSWDVLKDQTRP